MRVQKSYLVAVEKISGLEGNQIMLENDKIVMVGESYKQKVYDLLNSYMIHKKKE